MKKRLCVTVVISLLILFSFAQFTIAVEEMSEVKLVEVVHSIFYAPQYVALEKGYFTDEGINVKLSTAWGGDKAAATLMSGSSDIALIGPEPTIYIYQQGAKNHLVNFAQLTNTAGSFLVAREPMPDFTWEDVRGKTIIGNRPGGAPQMVLEYSLKTRDIHPGKDVEILTNLDFTANAGAFVSGTGDFVQLFEPAASKLESEKQGYVVASLGEAGGNVPYTVYMARNNYIKENPEIIQAFTNAIYRSQQWVEEHSVEEIADVISPFFSDTEHELLVNVVSRYKNQGTWDKNPLIEKDIFEHYEDIIIMAGELKEKVPYETLVRKDFARKAIEK